MLNKEQIQKVILLDKQKVSKKEIAQKLNTKPPEITYTLNTYKNLFKDKKDYNYDLDDLDKQKAFIRLFWKHIRYKYSLKSKQLEIKYSKELHIKKDLIKTLKDENFMLNADIKKVAKEKLDCLETYANYKSLNKIKYILFFLLGNLVSIGIVTLINYLRS